MSINANCNQCHRSFKVGTTICPQCQTKLKSYRIRLKLPSGKWASRTAHTLTEARKIEAGMITQASGSSSRDDRSLPPSEGVSQVPTLGEVWQRYLASVKLTKRSWKSDLCIWRVHLEHRFEDMRMDRITRGVVHEMMDELRQTQSRGVGRRGLIAPRTQQSVLMLLKSLFTWASRRGIYDGPNGPSQVQNLRFDNRVTTFLSREEVQRLLTLLDEHNNERFRLVVLMALYSGQRRGSILKLQWQDVDLEHRVITFRPDTMKGNRVMTLPINDRCLELLQRAEELRVNESPWVFPCGTGQYFHSFTSIWTRFTKKHSLAYRFHDLRHTFASTLVVSGVSLYTVKELLGHRDVKTTERYAHLNRETLVNGMNVINAAF
jgi:integrase